MSATGTSLAKGLVLGYLAGEAVKWVMRQPLYVHAGYVHAETLRSGTAPLHQHGKTPSDGRHVALYRVEGPTS